MRRTLATILAATAISTGYACVSPNAHLGVEHIEPSHREERIAWRSDVGAQVAFAYVLNDCIEPSSLEERFAEYGEPYGLSSRDVAESALWGVYHHRYRLDLNDHDTLDGFLDAMIDTHGDRIVETLDILFSGGEYDQLINWYIYGPMKRQLHVDTVDELQDRVDGALAWARFFTDLESMYDELRATASREASSRP